MLCRSAYHRRLAPSGVVWLAALSFGRNGVDVGCSRSAWSYPQRCGWPHVGVRFPGSSRGVVVRNWAAHNDMGSPITRVFPFVVVGVAFVVLGLHSAVNGVGSCRGIGGG
jgi:hypothetical protein